jgi:two-component system, NarL family, response regulator NreC
MTLTTIALADDHHLVRQGLRSLLQAEPGFTVVGEASSGVETIALVERLQPHILIVDLMLPDLNGIEVTRQVRCGVPRTQVIILSMYADDHYVQQALQQGALGYVLKGASAADLIQAVKDVYVGHRYLSPLLREAALETQRAAPHAPVEDSYESLTTREREVLQLVARGYSNAQIAQLLSISPRTVESHRASVMRKLDLRNPVDLIRYALQRGLLPPQ